MITTIKQYLQPPHFEEENKNHQAYMLNIILVIMLSAVIVVGAIYFVAQVATGQSSETVTFLFIRLSLGMVAAYLFLRLGYIQIGGLILVILFLWFSYYQLPDSGVLESSYVLTFALPIVMATLVLGSRAGMVTALISSILLVISARNEVATITDLLLSLWTFYTGIYLSLAFLLRLSANKLRAAMSDLTNANIALQQTNEEIEKRVEERTNDLALAAEISRDLAELRDLESLLSNAAERIRHRFKLYYTQIYLVDTAQQSLILRAGTGAVGRQLLTSNHRLTLNANSINGAAAVNRTAVIVADTEKSPFFRHNPLLPETRSEMAVPLISGEKVVGVLDLQSRRPEALSEDNLAAFEILAGQLAIAIENARLIRDTTQAREELEARARYNVRTNWDNYMDAIHQGEFLGYRFEEGQVQPVSRKEENQQEDGRALNAPITLAGETIGRVSMFPDDEQSLTDVELDIINTIASQISQQVENLRLLNEAERYRQEAEEVVSQQTRRGWQAFLSNQMDVGFSYDQNEIHSLSAEEADRDASLSIDLRVRNEPIGKMEVNGMTTASDLNIESFLTTIANRLSAHIENLRLTEQSQQALAQSEARSEELEVLNEMSRALSAQVNVDGVIETIYEYTSKLMETANFYVALYDPERDEIEFTFDMTEGKARWHAGTRPAGTGLSEYLLKSGKPLLLPNNVKHRLKALGLEKFGGDAKSWIGTPLILGDQPIGAMGLQSYTTSDAYNEQHVRLLTAVASQAAIAIESARLFEQIQGQARQEQILREVTARVHAAVDAESILRTAAQEINRSLGLDTFIYLENDQDSDDEPEPAPANGSNGRGSSN